MRSYLIVFDFSNSLINQSRKAKRLVNPPSDKSVLKPGIKPGLHGYKPCVLTVTPFEQLPFTPKPTTHLLVTWVS